MWQSLLPGELLEREIGERERARQSGRLDAVEVQEAGDAVLARTLNQEVRGGRAPWRELRSDAGVPGRERAVAQGREVATNGVVEGLSPALVERVVDVVDPRHV